MTRTVEQVEGIARNRWQSRVETGGRVPSVGIKLLAALGGVGSLLVGVFGMLQLQHGPVGYVLGLGIVGLAHANLVVMIGLARRQSWAHTPALLVNGTLVVSALLTAQWVLAGAAIAALLYLGWNRPLYK